MSHEEDMKSADEMRTLHGTWQLDYIVIGLLIAYSPSYINSVLRWAGVNWGSQGPPSVVLWNWMAVGILLAFILKVEGRRLESIALKRPGWKDIQWAVIFLGASCHRNPELIRNLHACLSRGNKH